MAEDIVKLLVRPDSPIILVFDPITDTQFQGGAKYTGVGKICYFRLKLPFISETIRDKLIIAMKR